jgi:hypothetical protein
MTRMLYIMITVWVVLGAAILAGGVVVAGYYGG